MNHVSKKQSILPCSSKEGKIHRLSSGYSVNEDMPFYRLPLLTLSLPVIGIVLLFCGFWPAVESPES